MAKKSKNTNQEKKKQTKTLWLYSVILFTVAFVLILFGAFSGKDGNFHHLFIDSNEVTLLSLTDQNEQLRAEIETQKGELLKKDEEHKTAFFEEKEKRREITTRLILSLIEEKKYDEAEKEINKLQEEFGELADADSLRAKIKK